MSEWAELGEWVSAALALMLLAAAAVWARRESPAARRLKVLAAAGLGTGRSLAVVRVGSRCFLLASSAKGLDNLAELDAAEWADEQEPSVAPRWSLGRAAKARKASEDGG